MLFCCGSIFLAQTRQRKPAAKCTTVSNNDKREAEKNASVETQSPQDLANTVANPKLQPDTEVAVLETDYGIIIIELYPKLTPQMVERFNNLIKGSFYNGITFHRTLPSLGIIHPDSKDADPGNDGYGSSSYPIVPAEYSDISYERDIVGAARASDPNSANSQFFIMLTGKKQSYSNIISHQSSLSSLHQKGSFLRQFFDCRIKGRF